MTQLEMYKHSGQLGAGILVVPLVGILSAVLLGIAYSYADVYSPVAGYISLLLVFAFALGVGYAVFWGAILSKCRNSKFIGLVGFAAGLLALYTAWVTFVFALFQRYGDESLDIGLTDLFFRPSAVWAFAKLVNETGWYSIGSGTPSGIILWLFWGIEAGIIVIVTPLVALMSISGRVFCENIECWCERRKNYFRVGIIDNEECLQRVAEGDIEALAELPSVARSDAPAIQVDLHRTNDPDGTRAIQLKLVKLVQEKKGDLKEDTDDLTPICLLSREQYEYIEALAQRVPEKEQLDEDDALSPELQEDEEAET